jgi:hypothetical protein
MKCLDGGGTGCMSSRMTDPVPDGRSWDPSAARIMDRTSDRSTITESMRGIA